MEQRYCDQSLLEEQVKGFDDLKIQLDIQYDNYQLYQQHLQERKQFDNFHEFDRQPYSLVFDYMINQDDKQLYIQQDELEEQNNLQHKTSQQLFLKMYKKTIQNKTRENVKREIKQKNQKAQDFMNKFQDKKQKYKIPKQLPPVKQQLDYRSQFIQNANLIFGCDLKQSKEPYDLNYQPFIDQYNIQQQIYNNKQIKYKQIQQILPFISYKYKEVDHKPQLIYQAEQSIFQIDEEKTKIIQKSIEVSQDVGNSRQELKIKEQEKRKLDQQLTQDNTRILMMEQQLIDLTKFQHDQKNELQQQLSQKIAILNKIQNEQKELARKLIQKQNQEKAIQKYINDTLMKEETIIRKQQNDAQIQIASLEKKCSIQENNLLTVEEAKAKVLQKIYKRQNEYSQYQEKADGILQQFINSNLQLYQQITNQQTQISQMFEAIKKKYKNICDLQKEIEKINKK